MSWTDQDPALAALDAEARAKLDTLTPIEVPKGAVLFSPGEAVQGYVIMLSGRVGVHLLGPTGRDILLYEVIPGQSCIQSTLGLLGGDAYSAEAVATRPSTLVLLPRPVFSTLLDNSHSFRQLVFQAFAGRMRSMMQLIENVSFMRVEARLGALIAERADANGNLHMTQADMATAIGSAREVVSRRLEKMAKAGLLHHERGEVQILDRAALRKMAQSPAV